MQHQDNHFILSGNGGEIQWCFSQVKGAIEIEDVAEGMAFYRLSRDLSKIGQCSNNIIFLPIIFVVCGLNLEQ